MRKFLQKLFIEKTDNTFIQFFRYVFVGGIATVVDWGSSSLCFYLLFHQKHAVLSNTIGFVLGLVVNFCISTLWVFQASKVKSKWAEFLGFAAVGVVGLLITFGITAAFTAKFEGSAVPYQPISKVLSTAVSFLWNFFARKYLLYHTKENEGETK